MPTDRYGLWMRNPPLLSLSLLLCFVVTVVVVSLLFPVVFWNICCVGITLVPIYKLMKCKGT